MSISDKRFEKIENEFKSEKNFFDVVKNSYKVEKPINVFKNVVIIAITTFLGYELSYPIMVAPESSKCLIQIFDIGLVFSVGILGFLIAGFSIYSTFLDRDLMYVLITYKEKKDKFNKFHKNYLFFFKPFFLLFILLASSILGKIAMCMWSGLKSLIEPIIFKYIGLVLFNRIGSISIAFYFVFILANLIALKDFIYNIYNSAKTIGRLNLSLKYYKCTAEDLVDALDDIGTEDNKEI